MAPFLFKKEGMKRVEQPIYGYLIRELRETHERIDVLKCFKLADKEKRVVKVRVVDPRQIPKNLVSSYTDLDTHPELILYEGYYSMDDAAEVFVKKGTSSPSA